MDRVQLRLEGKKNFKKNRGASIAACLPYTLPNFIIDIAYLVMIVFLVSEVFTAIIENYSYGSVYNPYYQQSIVSTYTPLFNVMDVVSRIITPIIFAAFLKVLINKFFLINREQSKCKASEAFSSFKGSEYFKTLGGMFLISLWLIVPYVIKYLSKCLSSYSTFFALYLSALFSLLYIVLLIMGIIKFYFSYFMVPYILAENPNIKLTRAVTISNKTMNGAKGELFLFYLSFIGWKILSGLTLDILDIFYVRPYFEAAKAEFYVNMKRKAKKMNICRPGELM